MSILLTQQTGTSIMFVSDSRSSRYADTPGIQHEFSDDYKKICYYEDTNLILGSTGLNEFGNDTFSQIADNCYHAYFDHLLINPINSGVINDFLENFAYHIQYFVKATSIAVGFIAGYFSEGCGVLGKYLFPILKEYIITPDKINSWTYYEQNKYYVQGETLACEFVKRSIVSGKTDNDRYNDAKNLIQDLITVENKHFCVSVIGGQVQGIMIDRNGIVYNNFIN